ncbi:MAG: hypothetical protein COW65_09455 [Cytophagales bacterium CG18_big_fil_WC_8_21_14_2_50_42_9]|nr:MAG: hypothetical protein COW65_09455 [Cytophagales bacterium CG18_big_fil_WC_8_21_14_2_50_42_9]
MKSVGLTDGAHEKLKKYCERNGLGQGEFISAALVYFEKNGINPATHESPAVEMNRLIKRLDQVIAFIRKQESDLLRPMVEAVSISEARIDKSLQHVATNGQMEVLASGLDKLVANINKLLPVHQQEAAAIRTNTEKLLQEHAKRELAAFEVLSRFLDEKGKGGLLASITKAFKE